MTIIISRHRLRANVQVGLTQDVITDHAVGDCGRPGAVYNGHRANVRTPPGFAMRSTGPQLPFVLILI